MKKFNGWNIVVGLFGMLGIGLIALGVWFLTSGLHVADNAVEITATITSITSEWDYERNLYHDVYIDYTYDGKDYQNVKFPAYNSSMYIGQEITVLCNPDNPEEVDLREANIYASGVLWFMGAGFCLLAFLLWRVVNGGIKVNKRLLREGKVLHATVDNICLDTKVKVNGRSPFVIYCSYRDEYQGVTYEFKSNYLYADPAYVVKEGEVIDVYVQPDDFTKYYVDIERRLQTIM